MATPESIAIRIQNASESIARRIGLVLPSVKGSAALQNAVHLEMIDAKLAEKKPVAKSPPAAVVSVPKAQDKRASQI